MQLDHDQLRELLTFLGESDIQELRLEGEDFRLVVRRNLPTAAPTAEAAPPCLLSPQLPQPLRSRSPPPSLRRRPPPAAATSSPSRRPW